MPGQNPREAVEEFLNPLRAASSVLDGHAQLLVRRTGDYRTGVVYAWTLCGPRGMELRGLGHLHAEMRFEIVESDPARHGGMLHVATRGYRYRLEVTRKGRTKDLWMIHWHPNGDSPYKEPHIHIPDHLSRHLPTGWITFEKVIGWCVDFGAPLAARKGDVFSQLALTEAPNLFYRRWDDSPRESAC